MVNRTVVDSIHSYMKTLRNHDIPVLFTVLFGSYARNDHVTEWSDIDLLVISPRYDQPYGREGINQLWRIAARVDSRIEPIAVGLNQWLTNDGSTIIEMARREGVPFEFKYGEYDHSPMRV